MLPYLRLGPFLIQTSGLALLLGLWLGTSLIEKEANRLKLNSSAINSLIFTGLMAGIVGARLAYAALSPGAYLANPLSLLAINTNTLSVNEGLVIGIAAALLYGWRKRLPLRPTLDAFTPGVAVFLAALGIAHFLSGDAFGAPAKLPWSIYLWSDYRHPSQVYETFAAALNFLILRKRPLEQSGEGLNFALLVALFAGSRIILEAFRGDSLILAGGLRAAQVAGLFVLALSLWLLKVWRKPIGSTEHSSEARTSLEKLGSENRSNSSEEG